MVYVFGALRPMRLALLTQAALALFVLAASASAQQQVRLKSGGVLLGAATVEGADAKVVVGDATLSVPLADIAEITAVAKAEESLPRRLLTTALEARILSGAGKESVGILAEAARLAPDDPQIAFWYATSLLDAGQGTAASHVLSQSRAAIDKAYPGFGGQLAGKIERRRKLEGLPAAMLARVDEINAGPQTVRHSNNNERRLYSAIFRLVDQSGAPVAQNAFSIQCNGYDEQLQVFPGGYGLLTFTRDVHRSDEPSIINVKQLGLKPARFELDAAHGQVGELQEFAAHRFGDEDKRMVRIQLVDREGRPVPDARIELEPVTGRGRGVAEPPRAMTGKDGDAVLASHPGGYYARAQAAGFSAGSSDRIDVVVGTGEIVVPPITMFRTVGDSLQIHWRWKPTTPAAEETSGDAMLSLKAMRTHAPSNVLGHFQAIQAMQIRDQLAFQMIPFQAGGYAPQQFADMISIRELRVKAAEGKSLADATEERFDSIDLTKLGDLEKELKPTAFATPHGPAVVIPKSGRIYICKFPSRDLRLNQPGELTFKLMLVGDETGAGGDDEAREDAKPRRGGHAGGSTKE